MAQNEFACQIWVPFNQNHYCNVWPVLFHFNILTFHDLVQTPIDLKYVPYQQTDHVICHVQIKQWIFPSENLNLKHSWAWLFLIWVKKVQSMLKWLLLRFSLPKFCETPNQCQRRWHAKNSIKSYHHWHECRHINTRKLWLTWEQYEMLTDLIEGTFLILIQVLHI
jgi:hypothetical protein